VRGGIFLDRTVGRTFGTILAAAALASCGSNSPSSPSPASPGGSNSGITVTITSSGVSPKQITVPQGTRVLFVNNDVQSRQINSDPHPEHTDCVEINNIGLISPGQTKETGNLNTVKTCGYHDHGNPDDARFKGSIVIQ
jgi:plastocyanin